MTVSIPAFFIRRVCRNRDFPVTFWRTGHAGRHPGGSSTDWRHADLEGIGLAVAFTQLKEKVMKFLVMVKADKNSEAGVMPTEELLTEMTKFRG